MYTGLTAFRVITWAGNNREKNELQSAVLGSAVKTISWDACIPCEKTWSWVPALLQIHSYLHLFREAPGLCKPMRDNQMCSWLLPGPTMPLLCGMNKQNRNDSVQDPVLSVSLPFKNYKNKWNKQTKNPFSLDKFTWTLQNNWKWFLTQFYFTTEWY